MVRVVLIAVGSRGDAEPFVALADSLVASTTDCSVDLFFQKDAVHLVVPHQRIRVHEVPFTQMDFYQYMSGTNGNPPTGANHPNPRVQFLGIVTDIMGGLVLPCYSHVRKSLSSSAKQERVNAVVVSSLARQLGLELAAQLAKPVPSVYLVQLQSLIPTNDHPHYSETEDCIQALVHHKTCQGMEYRQTFIELERYQFDFLNAHRKILKDMDDYDVSKALEWNFEKDMVPVLTGHPPSTMDLDVWMINAVSTHLIPPPSDTGSRVCHVGALADLYIPRDYEPPNELVDFLHQHDGEEQRPLCFGYGSMPFANLAAILEAIYEVRQPTVMVGRSMVDMWNKVSSDPQVANHAEKLEWIQTHTYAIESAPYAWLLPQCSVMFSHGGAGVVHATLRAGIPAAISPMMGDQFFFARYLEAKGWGVRVSDVLAGLSKENIIESIQKAKLCKEACQSLAQKMAQDESSLVGPNASGADVLAYQIKEHVSRAEMKRPLNNPQTLRLSPPQFTSEEQIDPGDVGTVAFYCSVPNYDAANEESAPRLEFSCRGRSVGYLVDGEEAVTDDQLEEQYSYVDPCFYDTGYSLAGRTGFQVWAGSRLLLTALSFPLEHDHPRLIEYQSRILRREAQYRDQPRLRVLELGSGVGLVGTALAAAGAEVLLTDLPSLVENALVKNLELNETPNVSNEPIPTWLEPAQSVTPIHKGWAGAVALDWTKSVADQLDTKLTETLDVIVASDCVWLVSMLQALLDTVESLFKASTSHEHRPTPAFFMSFQRRDTPNSDGSMFTTVDGVVHAMEDRGWKVDCVAWMPVNVEVESDKRKPENQREVYLFDIQVGTA